MAKNHEWTYKYLGDRKWLITCAECGKIDGLAPSEAEAKVRISALLHPIFQGYGFNRRNRKARNARKQNKSLASS